MVKTNALEKNPTDSLLARQLVSDMILVEVP